MWLLKRYQYGVVLLVVSGFVAYGFRPIAFYPQATGIVESIREDFYFTQGGVHSISSRVDITTLIINGVEYIALRNEVYATLIKREVVYRWTNSGGRRRIIEIIYDGEVLNPPKKDPMRVFIPVFALFILGLLWCSWVWGLKWRSNRKN